MTGSARPLKVGVMSFAHVHAWSYLAQLLAADGVEVLSADPGGRAEPGETPRGADFAALLDAPYVDSYEELFAWGPDAVVICAENTRHRELVQLATAAGAHVLCEKPLAATVEDAREIVDLADAAGVLLMTAFPIRFTPSFRELSARVAAGEVGEVLAVLGTNNGKIPMGDRRWFTDPELAGGGALVDHVVHCADLLDVLLGEAPETVFAHANGILHADQHPAVETGGLVVLGYPSGVIATIDCSWSQPATAAVWGDVTLQVTGTAGVISMSAMGRAIAGTDVDGHVWLPFGADLDGLMVDHFLECVRTGDRPRPDGAAGVRATRVAAAAQASTRTGSTVRPAL
jgi:predicted dehydrogenase